MPDAEIDPLGSDGLADSRRLWRWTRESPDDVLLISSREKGAEEEEEEEEGDAGNEREEEEEEGETRSFEEGGPKSRTGLVSELFEISRSLCCKSWFNLSSISRASREVRECFSCKTWNRASSSLFDLSASSRLLLRLATSLVRRITVFLSVER